MSILSCLDGYMNGNSWEELCVDCYRMRYQDDHYEPIPAAQGGDGGIEGYTQSGIVHQCYCPEKNYSDQECYEHIRDKMTSDIKKLLDPKYQKRLFNWGVPPIREWHFVIPKQDDSRILKHAEDKRKEVIAAKSKTPDNYPCIHEFFKIIIKCADDFKLEICKIVLTPHRDYLLNLKFKDNYSVDYTKCDSLKAKNITRKIRAVIPEGENKDEYVQDIVSFYIQAYIKGMDILNDLMLSFPKVYEILLHLEQSYKNDVYIKTRMISNKCDNSMLFNEILNEFEKKLNEQFSNTLDIASIGELKHDLVASWLADCSMEFRK